MHGRYGTNGDPDQQIVMPPEGRHVYVELKTKTGRLTPRQAHRIDTLRAIGCEVHVAYGALDVKKLLRELDATHNTVT